ncbi:MAG: BatD family protein, partial [Myxococcota bacterium]|nr:BatD family protein [Myxococcota bacterium]
MRLRTVILIAALCSLSSPALSQGRGASVSVEPDRRAMTVDDDLQIVVSATGDFDSLKEPDMKGFQVVGKSESTQTRIVNMNVTRIYRRTYQLRPIRAGKLTIGPAAILQDGRVVARSPALTISVTEPAAGKTLTADEQQGLVERGEEPLFLAPEFPRNSYYVGEPFVMSWNLNYRPEYQVRGIEIRTMPKLKGLLAEELRDDVDGSVRSRRIGGQRYNTTLRARHLATGLAVGTVLVDPMSAVVSIGRGFRTRTSKVRSRPFELAILPLPEQGRPRWFQDGNIGHLNMRTTLKDSRGRSPHHLQMGERLILEVEVRGTGNLGGLKPPILEGGGAFDIQQLPSASDDVIEIRAEGPTGRRVFQYLLVATAPGDQRSPSVHFAFFDPLGPGYREQSWPGKVVKVTGQAPAASENLAALSGEDIGPQIERHTVRQGPLRVGLTPVVFWALVVLPMCGVVWTEGRARRQAQIRSNPFAHRSKNAYGNAQK